MFDVCLFCAINANITQHLSIQYKNTFREATQQLIQITIESTFVMRVCGRTVTSPTKSLMRVYGRTDSISTTHSEYCSLNTTHNV